MSVFDSGNLSALGLAVRVALSISLSLLAGIYIGRYLGRQFGNEPFFLLFCAALGLVAGFREAIRLLLKK
jgi:F0F1-type ATP synthase assembly protein I